MENLSLNTTKIARDTFSLQSFLEDRKFLTVIAIFLTSCLMGIFAQIKIPLYFTPVPLTMQTVGVMLAGALLGSRNGALAVLCYLFQGCCGLPVWAGGHVAGVAHFMGPTGGYLVAWVVQAYIIGWFFEKKYNTSLIKTSAILLFSTFLQLSVGTLWLAQFVGVDQCLMCGFYPFIPGDTVKALFVAACLSPLANKTIKSEV